MAISKEQSCKAHDTGAVSELMVRAYLTSLGFDTFSPDKLHTRVDFIYVKSGIPIRVQVKTSTYSVSGKYQYEQCRLQKKGYKGQIDPVIGYSESDVDEVWIVGTHLWCFPIDVVSGKPSLFLTSNNPSPVLVRRTYDPNEFIVVVGSPDRKYRDRLAYSDEGFIPPTLGKKSLP